MQLWQEQGEAQLNSQDLYCISAEGSQLPLFRMNISQCGERAAWPCRLRGAGVPQTPEVVPLASLEARGFLSPPPSQPRPVPWVQRWLTCYSSTIPVPSSASHEEAGFGSAGRG